MATKSTDLLMQNRIELQKSLGYEFGDLTLLESALTHRSYRFENNTETDNQRLEFLGDSVLGFLLADRVFRGYAEQPEGLLTVLRASVASGVALANKARRLHLGDALLLGHGERTTGGQDRESNLADVFEALLGAIYLDGGIEAVATVFDSLFAEELSELNEDPWSGNPKGHLQSIAQKDYHVDPVYETLEETGPQHCTSFRVCVSIGEALKAEGTGGTKRAAQSMAATRLLKELDIK